MFRQGPLREEAVARALEHATTRRIVALCISRARSVKEISDGAEVPLATTYRQVRRLVDDGVLVIERSAMTPDGKPYDLYRSRVRAARVEVVAEGVRVSWESNESVEDRLAQMWDHLGG